MMNFANDHLSAAKLTVEDNGDSFTSILSPLKFLSGSEVSRE
jgi:hypothetical protein